MNNEVFAITMIICKAQSAKSQIPIFKYYLKENNFLSLLKAKVKNAHFWLEYIYAIMKIFVVTLATQFIPFFILFTIYREESCNVGETSKISV